MDKTSQCSKTCEVLLHKFGFREWFLVFGLILSKLITMLKYLFVIGLMLCCRNAFAQSDTQVFLFDMMQNQDSIAVKNGRNISQNPGYNNQPSFFDDNQVLYSKNKNGQTDIALYDIKSASTTIISEISGSEFSPMRIPETDQIAAVRLDTNGLQRLYRYSTADSALPHTDESTRALSTLKIGYFDFYDKDEILASVLTPTSLDLYLIDLKAEKDSLIIKDIGCSIHKVPGMNAMSYTLINEEQDLDLYLLDMESLESYFVCVLPIGIQYYTWLDKNRILLGSRNKLFVYDTLMSNEWREVADLKGFGIKTITRLAVSPSGDKIALVAEKSK